MTNYPSKTLSDAVFLLNAENCLLKWLPKKGHERNSRYALFLPVIGYHFKNLINIFKDILTMNLAFRTLQREKYLTYKMINYGECKAKRPQQLSGALLVFFSLYRFCCCDEVFVFDFFHSASFFVVVHYWVNYGYYSWAIELKNCLLFCIFTMYLIHSQLFIRAMLFRLGGEIAYLHRAKKAVLIYSGSITGE